MIKNMNFKSIIIYIIFFLLLIFQTSFPHYWNIMGVSPNWVLAFLISWLIILNEKLPWNILILAGIMLSLVSHWSYLWWLIIAIVTLSIYLLKKYMKEINFDKIIIVLVVVLVNELVTIALSVILDRWDAQIVWQYIWRRSWLIFILNSLIALLFVYINQWWYFYRKSTITFEKKN